MPEITKLEPRISIISVLVSDIHRSFKFYADGLGLPTSRKPEEGWVAFRLNGICLCIYPYADMAKESVAGRRVDPERALDRGVIPPVCLAYNTREKHQVAEVLDLARRAGGTIEKEPADTFWGGYAGYFADPDGHLWEVAWGPMWEFHDDGSLVVP